jgi:hypothetical protein
MRKGKLKPMENYLEDAAQSETSGRETPLRCFASLSMTFFWVKPFYPKNRLGTRKAAVRR